MNQGMRKKRQLWSVRGRAELEKLPLAGWTAKRRADLLGLLAMLDKRVAELDQAVERAAGENADARLLTTQPGVDPNTALAFVLTVGDVSRFRRASRWPAISA